EIQHGHGALAVTDDDVLRTRGERMNRAVEIDGAGDSPGRNVHDAEDAFVGADDETFSVRRKCEGADPGIVRLKCLEDFAGLEIPEPRFSEGRINGERLAAGDDGEFDLFSQCEVRGVEELAGFDVPGFYGLIERDGNEGVGIAEAEPENLSGVTGQSFGQFSGE